MVAMFSNLTIDFQVAVVILGTRVTNVHMVTFDTMVTKITSVHWLLRLCRHARNVSNKPT
jgi:hypothetical protein